MTYEERLKHTVNEYTQKFCREFDKGKTAKENVDADQALMVADCKNIAAEFGKPFPQVLEDMGRLMLKESSDLKVIEQALRGFLRKL